MALAIDGEANGFASGSLTATASLTTTSTNDYIIACVRYQGAVLSSVSGSTLGAFTQISDSGAGGAIWAKFSTGTLTSETITGTQNQSVDMAMDVFGVKGSNQTSLVFDAGGPIAASSSPQNFTTVNTNTMLISTMNWFIVGPGAGTGFTAISGSNTNAILSQYKVLSATATTSIGSGNDGLVNSFNAIAIVQTTGGSAFIASRTSPILQAVKRASFW